MLGSQKTMTEGRNFLDGISEAGRAIADFRIPKNTMEKRLEICKELKQTTSGECIKCDDRRQSNGMSDAYAKPQKKDMVKNLGANTRVSRSDWSEYNTGIAMWKSSYSGKLPYFITQLCLPNKCDICSGEFQSPVMARMHYLSRNHSFKAEQKMEYSDIPKRDIPEQIGVLNKKLDVVDYCSLCNVHLTSTVMWKSHFSGKKHNRALRLQPKFSSLSGSFGIGLRFGTHDRYRDTGENYKRVSKERYLCDHCNVLFRSKLDLEAHEAGKRHKRSLALKSKNVSTPSTSDVKRGSNTAKTFKCKICKIHTTSHGGLQIHYRGRRHGNEIKKSKGDVCPITFRTNDSEFQVNVE